jgi:hypothetical protein
VANISDRGAYGQLKLTYHYCMHCSSLAPEHIKIFIINVPWRDAVIGSPTDTDVGGK